MVANCDRLTGGAGNGGLLPRQHEDHPPILGLWHDHAQVLRRVVIRQCHVDASGGGHHRLRLGLRKLPDAVHKRPSRIDNLSVTDSELLNVF